MKGRKYPEFALMLTFSINSLISNGITSFNQVVITINSKESCVSGVFRSDEKSRRPNYLFLFSRCFWSRRRRSSSSKNFVRFFFWNSFLPFWGFSFGQLFCHYFGICQVIPLLGCTTRNTFVEVFLYFPSNQYPNGNKMMDEKIQGMNLKSWIALDRNRIGLLKE